MNNNQERYGNTMDSNTTGTMMSSLAEQQYQMQLQHQFVLSPEGQYQRMNKVVAGRQQGNTAAYCMEGNSCFLFPNFATINNSNKRKNEKAKQGDTSDRRNHSSTGNNNNTNPEAVDNIDQVERLLADAMTSLSLQERNRALEDLHGIRHAYYTSSSVVNIPASRTEKEGSISSLSEQQHEQEEEEIKFQQMKQLLEHKSNHAYRIALQQNCKYVNSTQLLRSFLKGSTPTGSIKEAVRKILGYFDCKLSMFGKEAICRELTLRDLDDDAMECFESGFYQYLGKDSIGRIVIGAFPCLLKYKTVDAFFKMSFYFWMSFFPILEKPDRDVVILQYSSANMKEPSTDVNLIWREITQFEYLPIKCCAYHVALDSRAQNSISFTVIKAASISSNVRTAFHFGRDIELQYDLRRFGINTNSSTFPVTLNGEIKHEIHEDFVKERKQKELMDDDIVQDKNVSFDERSSLEATRTKAKKQKTGSSSSNTYDDKSVSSPVLGDVVPTNNDVLFGRGFTAQHHPGNIKFRRLLEKHYDAYTNADDADKLVLVDYLSHQMNTTLGVRFLKSISVNSNTTNNHWEIVTDQKMIRSKFYQAFRNLRASYRRMELQQQQQQCQTKAVTTL